MPKKHSTHRKKVRGGSVWSWIKDKALPWIKKNKIVSRAAGALGSVLPGGWGTAAKGSLLVQLHWVGVEPVDVV